MFIYTPFFPEKPLRMTQAIWTSALKSSCLFLSLIGARSINSRCRLCNSFAIQCRLGPYSTGRTFCYVWNVTSAEQEVHSEWCATSSNTHWVMNHGCVMEVGMFVPLGYWWGNVLEQIIKEYNQPQCKASQLSYLHHSADRCSLQAGLWLALVYEPQKKALSLVYYHWESTVVGPLPQRAVGPFLERSRVGLSQSGFLGYCQISSSQ